MSQLQRRRIRRAYAAAGPGAVDGFRAVMRQIINDADRERVLALIGNSAP